MIEKSSRMSPFVLMIPLAVMAVTIIGAFFVASGNTELRSRASNDGVISCAKICQTFGGDKNLCSSKCESVIAGKMACDEFSEQYMKGASKMMINTCWDMYHPVGKSCASQCAGYSADGAGGACKTACRDVLLNRKTCTDVCAQYAQSPFAGQCMGICNKFSTTPAARSCKINCSDLPVSVQAQCRTICSDTQSSKNNCPELCSKVPVAYKAQCLRVCK